MRTCVLEHGDSLSMSRLAGKTKRGAALPGESATGLYERRPAQLDGVRKAWRIERILPRCVLGFRHSQLAGEYRRLSQPALSGGADSAAPEPDTVQTGPARTRTAQGWPLGTARHGLCNF